MADVTVSIGTIRYYAGWADKIQGKEIPVNPSINISKQIPDPRTAVGRGKAGIHSP